MIGACGILRPPRLFSAHAWRPRDHRCAGDKQNAPDRAFRSLRDDKANRHTAREIALRLAATHIRESMLGLLRQG